MIPLPDWAGWLILTACLGGAALAIAWGHARDVLASTLASVRTSQDEHDDPDDSEVLDEGPYRPESAYDWAGGGL